MNPNSASPRRMPLGGMIGGFDDFETEKPSGASSNQSSNNSNPLSNPIANAFLSAPADLLNPIGKLGTDLAKESVGAIAELGKGIFSMGSGEGEKKFSSKGKIDNFQNPTPEQNKKNQEAQLKRVFYSQMEESRRNVQVTGMQKTIEEAARFEVATMSTEEKLDNLHMNLDLDEKHINDPYHINELRRKRIEMIKKAKREQEAAKLAEATRGSNLLMNQNAHEGQSMTSSSGAIASAG